jgi:hypothetical protein
MKINLLCPECKRELTEECVEGIYELWCSYGPCGSKAAGIPTPGNSRLESHDRLVDNWSHEKAEQDDV